MGTLWAVDDMKEKGEERSRERRTLIYDITLALFYISSLSAWELSVFQLLTLLFLPLLVSLYVSYGWSWVTGHRGFKNC